MSVVTKLRKMILYQKPKETPFEFTAGMEDHRPAEEGISGGGPDEAGPPAGGQPGGESGKEQPRQVHEPSSRRRKRIISRAGAGGSEQEAAGRPDDTPERRHAGETFEKRVKKTGELESILKNKEKLYSGLDENRKMLERLLRYPLNKDAVLRPFSIGTDPPVRALMIFYDGITDKQTQNQSILQPLMLLAGLRPGRQTGQGPGAAPVVSDRVLFETVKDALLPGNQVNTGDTFESVVSNVLNGNTVIIIDGINMALFVESKGWEHRGVERPQAEAVIRGPQESFTEQIRTNISLVRKILHRPSLITEFMKVGGMDPLQCAIMYLDDVCNPDLVREVKRRLESIKADYVHESGILEQFIEDSPYHLAPQVLSTERPDRVAAGITEGNVAIFTGSNPYALVVPVTFFALMQAAEDAYLRFPFASFARLIRYLGLFFAMLLPGFYLAVVTHHQEFIPTDLLLAITGNRERVPFPSIVEVLLMEISFELIREAGIRIPGTVGTTLGIVGALILGQAAVAANIVSPILIVVVAVTALGSFAIPNYSLSYYVRMLRFGYILLAALMGLLGMVVGLFIHLGLIANMRSFGVPFMAPAGPVTKSGPDFFLRGPVWEQELRPDYLDPLRRRRQPRISRGWIKKDGGNGGGGGGE
ncbi:MAG: spore germination protein [Bacillota bacterium]